ncbi:motility associated factor glycosyltransferase family protein [Caminibacter sp.]
MQKLFEKNLKFFYKNIPAYYKLIANIKKRNYLIKNDNIIDLKGNFLYPNSISKDSATIAQNPINNPLWKKHFFFKTKNWDEKEFYITGKIINSFITEKERYFFDDDFLPTTVIFGLISGKFLEILRQNYTFQSLFIYEPNPEFFAISLYFIDYEKLYKKYNERLFLWVGGEIEYLAIEKFFYERVVSSSFINIFYEAYSHPLIEDAKNKFLNIQASKLRGWGTFEDEIKGIKNHFQNINRYPLFQKGKKLNIPFCIVANGKSLEKNISFIKKNKDSMIIVSVGTAIKPLLKAGIESDFHIEQERIPVLIEALKDVLPNYKGFFLGASVVNPEVFKMAKNPLMYIREAFSLENELPVLKGSSPIVGNSGFAFASEFTPEIYLCGMDLGFRLNEKKHANGSFYDSRDDMAKNGIKIKGNFSDDIYTDSLLLSSKQNIERMIKEKNLKVYNLSDGAYIEGSIPLKDKKLPKSDKEKYKKEMLSSFSNEKTNTKLPDIENLLKAVQKALEMPVKNQKELTGIVDFIEDMLKEYAKKDKNTFNLIRGSIFHILINFYAESFKNTNPKVENLNQFALFLKKLK